MFYSWSVTVSITEGRVKLTEMVLLSVTRCTKTLTESLFENSLCNFRLGATCYNVIIQQQIKQSALGRSRCSYPLFISHLEQHPLHFGDGTLLFQIMEPKYSYQRNSYTILQDYTIVQDHKSSVLIQSSRATTFFFCFFLFDTINMQEVGKEVVTGLKVACFRAIYVLYVQGLLAN